MSIKFVQSSDNKYVWFYLTEDDFTTDITKWLNYTELPKQIASQQILDIPDNLLITSIDDFNSGTIEEDGTITASNNNIYSDPIFLGKSDIMVYKGGIYNKPILSKTNAEGTTYSPIVIGYDTQTKERTYVAPVDIYVSVCTNKFYFKEISVTRASRTLEQIKTQINEGIFTPAEDFVFSTANLTNYANYKIYIKHSFVINSSFTFPDNVTLIFENGGKLVSGKEDKNLGMIANRLHISGKNLTIIADSNADGIVEGLIFSKGTLSNKEVYLSWFGNIEDIVFNESFEFTADDREKGTINQLVLANASYATQDTIIYINRNLGVCKLRGGYYTICNGHTFKNIGECKIFGVSETQSTLGLSRFKELDGLIFANVKIGIANDDGFYGSDSVNVTPIPFIIKNCKFLGSKHNSVCSINISDDAGSTINDYKTYCKNLQGSIICDNYFINGGGGDWRYGQSIGGNFALGTGGDAIFINTADGWVIERNTILGNYCFGIRSYSAENCIIKDNIINGIRIVGYGYQRGLVDGVTEGLIRCKEFDMIGAIKNYNPAQYQRPFARFRNNIISNNIVSNIMDEGICFESYINLCIYVGTCTASEIEEKEYKGNIHLNTAIKPSVP
jgi:parallel beta-helix repeat protein